MIRLWDLRARSSVVRTPLPLFRGPTPVSDAAPLPQATTRDVKTTGAAVAYDPEGKIWVIARASGEVQLIDPAGKVRAGPACAAHLQRWLIFPRGVRAGAVFHLRPASHGPVRHARDPLLPRRAHHRRALPPRRGLGRQVRRQHGRRRAQQQAVLHGFLRHHAGRVRHGGRGRGESGDGGEMRGCAAPLTRAPSPRRPCSCRGSTSRITRRGRTAHRPSTACRTTRGCTRIVWTGHPTEAG